MKTLFKVPMLILMMLTLVASSAIALPFSSTGVVDPNLNDTWSEAKLIGVAQFSLYVHTPGVSVNTAVLEFESDIFDLNAIDANDILVVNPVGWTTPYVVDIDNDDPIDDAKITVSVAGEVATSENTPIVIQFAYTLLDAEMFDNASGPGWEWDEGQAWGISYTLLDTTDILGLTSSGGSTAPVPEPATMLLLGTGLAGLATFQCRKAKK